MMRSADVVVLGLGPAGAAAAAEAARRGCKVIALDRKRAPGLPVQCAELVPQVVEVRPDVIRQRIDSMATFVEDDAPDVKRGFPGHMLDRAAFDASLVEEAVRAGADVRLSSFVRKVTGNGVVELADGSALSARVVVGADGPRSRAGRAIGSVNEELVETRQITAALREPYAASDIFLSAEIPGGYGWLFPKGDVAHLGAGVSPQYKARLKSIMARLHASQLGRICAEILNLTGGAIPVGGMRKPWSVLEDTVVLLAGDAAGLANPVTGAGIAAAVHSGRLAGQAAASGRFEEYEQELRDVYGAALDRALARRRELLRSKLEKAALRRGWIAYPEYWR
ncbi:MAG TPA: geranylgeranyl reductase family protein [Burkholderiales bacterium]|nr:geranylgeranyl reductase family protein [Burkholderiales bacterium]